MTALHKDVLDLSCNWKVSNMKELESCITIVNPKADVDFDDLVTLDSCISLSRDGIDHLELPEITFKVKQEGLVISTLFIVSEGRLLELYGRCGEYESTIKAETSDAGDDELRVYNARMRLSNLTPECSVRFAGLGPEKADMWLLGVGIVLRPITSHHNMAARVDQILQNSAVPLSAGAENCKRLVMHQAQHALPHGAVISEEQIKSHVEAACDKMETRLKLHIDEKFEVMQAALCDKLDSIVKNFNKED